MLRELERVTKYKDTTQDWPEFCKKLERLIRDGIRLRKSFDTLDNETYERRYHLFEEQETYRRSASFLHQMAKVSLKNRRSG